MANQPRQRLHCPTIFKTNEHNFSPKWIILPARGTGTARHP